MELDIKLKYAVDYLWHPLDTIQKEFQENVELLASPVGLWRGKGAFHDICGSCMDAQRSLHWVLAGHHFYPKLECDRLNQFQCFGKNQGL